jgi:4-hydroxybenzoate polyprenyltransferase
LALRVIAALAWSYLLMPLFCMVIALYLLLNLAYSLYLKHIAIIDITCISAGFLLRVIGGGILAGIALSPWLLIMTFLVSLFMGFGKRRDDVLLLQESGTRMRKSVDGYNLEFINAAMVAMASVLIVCYINYITSSEVALRITHPYFFVSVFFVTIAMLRYLQIALVEQKSGSPTKIVTSDAIIIVMIICWVLHFTFSIYA